MRRVVIADGRGADSSGMWNKLRREGSRVVGTVSNQADVATGERREGKSVNTLLINS